MRKAVDRIKVDETERIRTDIGDLKSLEESIGKVGLINPLIIDENESLVAGYRRLQACKNLGFQEVEVVVVDFNGDPLKKLDIEVAENFFRKDFTPEEILATEVKRREILESRRKKGIFERLWLWLKSLFSSAPSQKDRAAEKKKTAEERSTKSTPLAEAKEKDEVQAEEPGQEQEAAEEEETGSRNAGYEKSEATASRQHRRADRDRSITWRTS